MKQLMKYHKQSFPKELKKELERFNKKYKLKYDHSLKSSFYIMIFKTGLRNKTTIEKTFERFRNSQLDLWDNLSFNERNLLLSHEMNLIKAGMAHFEFEESTIYIPFFDVLMNNLYDREVAILELPQFFKLYESFESSMIDMSFYGMHPFIHNMSDLIYVCHRDARTVLYLEENKTFYCWDGDRIDEFPFYEKRALSPSVRLAMGMLLLESAPEDDIYDYAIAEKMLHPRLEKRLLRRKKL